MGVPYYGDFAEDDTVIIPFNTFSSKDPSESITMTTLIDSDIYVYKDGGDTEIATDGASVVINFDSRTGAHQVTINTAAHSDYATGSEYAVLIEGATVDTGNITAWIGTFSIERAGGVLALLKAGTVQVDLITINTVATQLQMLMDATTTISADDDLTGVVVDKSVLSHIMTPAANTDTYDASTDSLQALGADVDTLIAGVNVTSLAADVITPASVDEDADFTIQALSITNKLDAGSVEVDGTTTLAGAVALSSTLAIAGATTLLSASVTNQLDAGTLLIDGTVTTGAVTANAVTVSNNLLVSGTTTHTGAVTHTGGLASAITGNITGNLSGSVGSVSGAVGSVAGNVDGLVTGTVAGVTPEAAGVAPTATEIVDEMETQMAADPTGFKVNVMEINSTDLTGDGDSVPWGPS